MNGGTKTCTSGGGGQREDEVRRAIGGLFGGSSEEIGATRCAFSRFRDLETAR